MTFVYIVFVQSLLVQAVDFSVGLLQSFFGEEMVTIGLSFGLLDFLMEKNADLLILAHILKSKVLEEHMLDSVFVENSTIMLILQLKVYFLDKN